MNSNLDPHQQLEEWLVDGAANDPPREMAFHASMCEECLARLSAFDSLGAVDVSAAGSPPPLTAPTTLVVGLAWARVATALAGGVLALILVVAGASQLIGFVGNVQKPDASLVAVATETDGGPIGTFGPRPATEPSPSTGPTPTPIPTFIPLPTVDPAAAPLDFPNAPFVSVQGVSQTSVTIGWYPSSYGGPVQKWEIWRAAGGGWIKLGELYPAYTAYVDGGLSPDTVYAYRLRAVNTSGYSDWSNTVAPKTTPIPTSPPTPTPPPPPSPTPGTPQCSDGADNDSDGWTDYPADQGCLSALDDDETPANSHECNDGVDNEPDGYTDFSGGDPDCLSPFDDNEVTVNSHMCNNGIDDDGDHLVDSGEDPGCGGNPWSDSEGGPDLIYECNNGIDDDGLGDGIDYANGAGDPECSSWTDNSESS